MASLGTTWLISVLRLNETKPASKKELRQPFHDGRDEYDWLPADMNTSVDNDLETKLLERMPTLLGKSLPPCGPELQVAYENVLNRLRCLWLYNAAMNPEKVPLLGICRALCDALQSEYHRYPDEGLYLTGTRKPWRREGVFEYEVSWAFYFVREADMMIEWHGMSENEQNMLELRNELHPIPRELGVEVIREENMKNVLDMWKTWNEQKRAGMYRGDDDSWVDIEDGETDEDGGSQDGDLSCLELEDMETGETIEAAEGGGTHGGWGGD